MVRRNTQEKKDRLLAGLVEARRDLLQAVRELPAQKREAVFLGTWSAADVVAHLIGWDQANLKAAGEVLDGRLPSFYAYHDPDWRSYNARLVAENKLEDFEALVMACERSHTGLIEALEGIPAHELERDRGIRYRGWRVTIARLLEAEMHDEQVHTRQVREYIIAPNEANLAGR